MTNDHLVWIQQENRRHRLYRMKENEDWQDCLKHYGSKPHRLWQTIDSLLKRGTVDRLPPPTDRTADMLSTYFDDKVNII